MATFKVGQRVRVVAQDPGANVASCIGMTGIIVSIPAKYIAAGECDVVLDEFDYSRWRIRRHACLFRHLAPLTDPKADEFIEQVKRWKPEPEVAPVAPTKREVHQ